MTSPKQFRPSATLGRSRVLKRAIQLRSAWLNPAVRPGAEETLGEDLLFGVLAWFNLDPPFRALV